jgi:hypothetical protein
VLKHRCGLFEQALGLAGVAGRKGDPGHPAQRIPTPRNCLRPEPLETLGEPVAGRVTLPAAWSRCPNRFSACATIALSSARRASAPRE